MQIPPAICRAEHDYRTVHRMRDSCDLDRYQRSGNHSAWRSGHALRGKQMRVGPDSQVDWRSHPLLSELCCDGSVKSRNAPTERNQYEHDTPRSERSGRCAAPTTNGRR